MRGGDRDVSHLPRLQETPLRPIDTEADQQRMQAEARQRVDEVANDSVSHGAATIMDNPGHLKVADDAQEERLMRQDEVTAARAANPQRYPVGRHNGGQEGLGRSMMGRLRGMFRRAKH
jgi:hypothetical protein